ncbi:MAG: glucosaminidase domain-containing protein [Deltaproteobacteria bacterium]|nr:glucosaminidase domain-containing protein [Deltaproteobacteria bacterium]
MRARLDAARVQPDARVRIDIVDHALADLAELATAGERPEASLVDGEALRSLVREAATLRAEAATGLAAFPGGARGEFLRAIAPGAVVGDWQFGVPASITMAQAILESGWGRSAPGYNLFGMKGEGTAGSERRRVVEYSHGRRQVRTAPFRSYHSLAESMADHARVLGTSSRYALARAAGEDPRAFAEALEGRYATDPRYAEKLAALSELYGLEHLNWRGRPPLAEPTGLPFLVE